MLAVDSKDTVSHFKPLQNITVTCEEAGTIAVSDGLGRVYLKSPIERSVSFKAAGALGTHLVIFMDEEGRERARETFTLNTKTEISDESGEFKELLDMLYYTMVAWHGPAGVVKYNGKYYHEFVIWLRDHVHALKGMKYYYNELKSGIDLYADSQREDGMIWDNYYPRSPEPNMWDVNFAYDDFILPVENGTMEWKRIPVENDVEFLFLEGLYFTWKATGDTVWMKGLLDNAMRAVNYSTTSPYRWSEKYKLLKRGFTIDTWDFQSAEDSDISGHGMVVDKDKTRFGIMYGDNTGFIAGLQFLSEMLEAAGRKDEAPKYRDLADDMTARLNKLSWNGEFFTHHVPEDGSLKRDLGVDLDSQVSLSNSYSLNRGITHEQAVAIIKTYLRIKDEMPKTSFGEWYQIYPPFEKGFGGHNEKWEYMNSGVTTIVAGELAHGAFENGFEKYGTDILKRLIPLGKKHNGYFNCTYRGAMPEEPDRTFTQIDLKNNANTDFCGAGGEGVTGWTGEGVENDLSNIETGHQEFHTIPFDIIDPAANGRKGCIGLSSAEGYLKRSVLPIAAKAESIYFHHTMSGGPLAGTVTLVYEDGSDYTDYIRSGKIGGWWIPSEPKGLRNHDVTTKVAWRGENGKCLNVGTYVYGQNNPNPDKTIKEIVFESTRDGTKWFILSVSLCDSSVFFMPSDLSFGIPDNWGAGAVVYALIEGLAGVKDTGVAFSKALLAPRWPSADVKEAQVSIKYEASGGYLSYTYSFKPGKEILIEFTGTADLTNLEILLPEGASCSRVSLDGQPADVTQKKVESSTYICCGVRGIHAHRIVVTL